MAEIKFKGWAMRKVIIRVKAESGVTQFHMLARSTCDAVIEAGAIYHGQSVAISARVAA